MNFYVEIPEPVFWVGSTVVVLIVLWRVANLLYPDN